MTFQQLNYLLEVGKTGSVSSAAKNLFVSSSSVSISLNALEKELGYPLFIRTQKGLVPTEQGKLVLDYAEQICRTHTLLNAVGRDSVRTLRISCSDQPPIIKAYTQLLLENQDRADLRIENVSFSGEDMYRKLMDRELDLSIANTISFAIEYWERKLRKGGLHRQVLKIVPAVIQVGPGHRLYSLDKINPYDLRNETFIDSSQGHTNYSGGNLFIDPNRVLHIARHGIRNEALMQGLGYSIAVMPPKGVPQKLRSIPLEDISFYFSAVTHTQVPLQPELMRLLQLVKENLEEAYPDY